MNTHTGRAAVVIGNFDGVHPGHREVLHVAKGAEPDADLVVVTFWPHPASVVRPGGGPKLLTDLDDRVALLREAGADQVEVIEFTRDFSQLSPGEFVDQVIMPLDPVRVVVGENFRFGHKAAGNLEALAALARGRFAVTGLPLVRVSDEETCSSGVRAALEAGDVRHASALLGRPFRFRGIVQHGDHRGRELGFPTANLPVPANFAAPADGVYAGYVRRLDGRDADGAPLAEGVAAASWPAAISVGTNPTFQGDRARRVESYVLDRDDLELYGVAVEVAFVDRLRGMARFDGIEALTETMRDDVRRARKVLGG